LDRYTEISSQSWGGRIGGAFKGILFGLILFIAAFPLLFWNEGRAVERFKTLEEGQGAVISLSSSEIDASAEGELVHTNGRAEPHSELRDPTFDVATTAIKLKRKVEMYQWRETSQSEEQKKLGGGSETVTTYSYDKGWSESHNSSTNFRHPEGHENPPMPYRSETQIAKDATLGAYRLPPFAAAELNDYRPLPVSDTAQLPSKLQKEALIHGGGFYIGQDPANPQVGDMRITFLEVGPSDISLVAKQSGDSFVPYQAQAGGTIALAEPGLKGAEAMFQQAHQSNTIMTWLLRGAGLLVMTIGINLMVRPLSVLADVVPALGSIVAAGTGIIAFLLALFFSFITIAIAWIFYRPLVGIGLLAVAGAAVYLTRARVAAKAPEAGHPAAPPPPPMH
jgi:hypothetical protein